MMPGKLLWDECEKGGRNAGVTVSATDGETASMSEAVNDRDGACEFYASGLGNPAETEQYLRTAVAFANASGGKLIFGVDNDSLKVIGFPDDEIFPKMDAIKNSIIEACEPAVVPVMAIKELDGKKILTAAIRPGMTKPYFLKKYGTASGTFIRMAGVTREASQSIIYELRLEGKGISFDTMQVKGEAVSPEEIAELSARMYQQAWDHCPSAEQKRNLKRVTANELASWKILFPFQGKYYPTNAWKLLTDPEELFPEAIIQMALFEGSTRAISLDRKEAAGPIDQQVEEAMKFVSRNIRLGACIAGVYREDAFELPMDSIREMITNAVCPRSYLLAGSVQAAICDDRLEVTSPGRLSSDLTIEKMIAGASRIRNVAIGAAFQYMRLVEKWGSGMPWIFQEAKAYVLKPPEIKDFDTSFRISLSRKPLKTDVSGVVNPLRTLSAGVIESNTNRPAGIIDFDTDDTNPAAGTSDSDTDDTNPSIRSSEFDTNPREASLTRNEQAILTILRSDARTTQKAMTEITGLSIATVKRLCAALQKKEIIRRKGSGRKGTWEIL